MNVAESIRCPFTVVVDTREQVPFLFCGFKADAKFRTRDGEVRGSVIPTVTGALKSGDYSIQGLESEIAVERKSLGDLYGTLGGGRERFVRELERLAELRVAHVVAEASWEMTLLTPPGRTKLSPKSVFRSINAWEQEFPTIHWQMMCSRALAEHKTFRGQKRGQAPVLEKGSGTLRLPCLQSSRPIFQHRERAREERRETRLP